MSCDLRADLRQRSLQCVINALGFAKRNTVQKGSYLLRILYVISQQNATKWLRYHQIYLQKLAVYARNTRTLINGRHASGMIEIEWLIGLPLLNE